MYTTNTYQMLLLSVDGSLLHLCILPTPMYTTNTYQMLLLSVDGSLVRIEAVENR